MPRDAELMARARRARDEVERRLGARPEVRMIDIGAATLPGKGSALDPARVVVQVHVTRPMQAADLGLEQCIDGIAVTIVPAAAYRPQQG